MLKGTLSGIILFMSFTLGAEVMQDHKQEISKLIQNYGSRYDGGYSVLEKGHVITITAQKQQFILDVVTDNPAQLTLQATLQRQGRLEYQREPFSFPHFPALTSKQLQQVDEILAAKKKLYLLTELNQYLAEIDLSKGHLALASEEELFSSYGNNDKNRDITVRHHYNPPYAVIFYGSDERWGLSGPFTLWFNLETKTLEGANWLAFPLDGGGMIPDDTFNFINQAMINNGDFGVYGSVSGGLEFLIQNDEVQIQESHDGNEYSVTVSPKNGYGHTLIFSINKTTGEVSNPISMHMMPTPMPTPMPAPMASPASLESIDLPLAEGSNKEKP